MRNVRSDAKIDHGTTSIDGGGCSIWDLGRDDMQLVFVVLQIDENAIKGWRRGLTQLFDLQSRINSVRCEGLAAILTSLTLNISNRFSFVTTTLSNRCLSLIADLTMVSKAV